MNLRQWWDEKMLWKRIGLHRCEICNTLCLLQYEVGVGYWCCKKLKCRLEASKRVDEDFEAWHKAPAVVILSSLDDSAKKYYEYKR